MNKERIARKKAYDKAWAIEQRLKDPEAWKEKQRIKARNRRASSVSGEKLRIWGRARYAANRDKIRSQAATRYASNANGVRDKALEYEKRRYASRNVMYRVRAALGAAKSRAKKRGIAFDLTLADMGSPTHCAVTGIEFDMTCSFRQGNIFVPSLDRIDPKLGYTKGNVRFVCHGYNLAKHTGTDANVVKLARAIVAMADQELD